MDSSAKETPSNPNLRKAKIVQNAKKATKPTAVKKATKAAPEKMKRRGPKNNVAIGSKTETISTPERRRSQRTKPCSTALKSMKEKSLRVKLRQ